MSLLPPRLLQRLTRSRLLPLRAVASTGTGERRSRAKGVGIEFADRRPYQLGDDIRHLDQHVFARLGEHHVREFSLYQQLPVTLLLDASASMRFGVPAKFDAARRLAAALGYVALAGGDRLLAGAFAGGGLRWFRPLHGVRRHPELFAWLERLEPHGVTDLAGAARLAAGRLRPEGLTIVLSDWLDDRYDAALRLFERADQELLAIQVLAPEEEDPSLLERASGALRLTDAEDGREVELALDADTLRRYRADFERWTGEVRGSVRAHRGRLLRVRSDADPERLLTREWRVAGVLT